VTTMLDDSRIANICFCIQKADALGVAGALAEFGTYLGGTAQRMSQASPKRRLFVFDTFEGLSEPVRDKDGNDYVRGQWKGALQDAAQQFIGLPVTIVQGEFPASAEGLDPVIAVAHLDLNLYAPTIAALNYVWQRMPAGGWIILDDFNYSPTPGIRKAVEEFGQPYHLSTPHQAIIERV
jgi:O-methyltransferase